MSVAQAQAEVQPTPTPPVGSTEVGGTNSQPDQPSADEIFRRIFGKERPPVAAGRYPVLLDGMPAGTYMMDPAGEGRIDTAFVRDLLLPILLDEHKMVFDKLIEGKERIGFGELRDKGFRIAFDPGELVLSVDVPMAIRSARLLQYRGSRPRADLAFAKQAQVSAYASVRAALDAIAQADVGDAGFSGLAADVDLGLNVTGLALQGRLRYAEGGGRNWTRGDFRATYDDVGRLSRYEAGDLSLGRRSYQRGGKIMGLSARREFRIDPYLNTRIAGARDFQIDRAARVDVLVNGSSGRTFSLPPGRYSLRDFASVPSAANNVELRITYASGEVETIRFASFYDVDLLAPGLLEFSANVGVPYRDEAGKRRYDRGDFNMLGYARYGVTSVLTLGASIEGNEKFTNVGAEATWASPVGSFFAAASVDARAPSLAAGSSVVLYSWRDADVERGRSVDAQVQLTGRDYRTLEGIFSGNLIAISSQVRLGQMLGNRTRLQVAGGYDRYRDTGEFGTGGTRYFVGGGLSHQARFGTIAAGVDYVRSRQDGGFSANLSFFVPIGRGTVTGNYSTRGNAARLEYSQIGGLGVGSVGMSAGLERTDVSDREFVRGSYVSNRFEGFADVVRTAAAGGLRDTRASLGVGTALVMADGAFAVSRPVANSFAIVEAPKSGGYAVDPTTGFGSSSTRYAAYTDWLGAAVVPDLQPYLERPIQVDPKNSRSSSGAGTIYSVKPGFRSGYLLKRACAAGAGSASIVGVLTDARGTPLPFASGEARPISHKDAEPSLVFTNGSGRFFLDNLMPGERYEISITVGGSRSKVVIEVPRTSSGPARLEAPIKLDVILGDKNAV